MRKTIRVWSAAVVLAALAWQSAGWFGSLIDRYGHVPNGTRTYYLSRSQPPVFYLIAALSRDPTTLATRQHWAIDLPAGIALAYAAHALAWRSADRVTRRSELPVAARSS